MDWKKLSRHANPWTAEKKIPEKTKTTALEHEEQALAAKLRSYCTHYGEEKKEHLAKCADLLLRLGQVYLQKAKIGRGTAQKLSFVRSCTLLTAARYRFETLRSHRKVQESGDLCRNLVRDLLATYCSSSRDFNLYEESKRIFRKLWNMRNDTNILVKKNLERYSTKCTKVPQCVQKLKILAENHHLSPIEVDELLSRPEEEKERLRRIRNIKDINEETTSNFRGLMGEISNECLKALGDVPCKFSIVGMGSLSREEVTLYSDFEHVIVLEQGVDSWDNYPSILEYFRWLSVLIQIVVIFFGETIIPSVQVDCLNEAYSGIPDKNWFYDMHTPKGLAFDGMLPHSCNIPLGRQKGTPMRPHTVEFIQTPKNMALYLGYEESLKNGYYLDEVLMRTCFVFGDKETYNCFAKERETVLAKQETKLVQKYWTTVFKNTNKYVRYGNFDLLNLTTFDCKNVFYRPIATLISFIAQTHGLKYTSTFQAIEKLAKIDIITSTLANELSYAFAVACELRIKLYSVSKQQRHGSSIVQVFSLVGEEGTWACKDMIRYLNKAASLLVGKFVKRSNVHLTSLNDYYSHSSITKLVMNVGHRGYYKEATSFGEMLRFRVNEKELSSYEKMMLNNYSKAAKIYRKDTVTYALKAEKSYRRIIETKNIANSEVMDAQQTLGILFLVHARYSEWMDIYRDFLELHHREQMEGDYHDEYDETYNAYHSLAIWQMEPTAAENHLRSFLWKNSTGINCEITEQFFVVKSQFLTWRDANLTCKQLKGLSERTHERAQALS